MSTERAEDNYLEQALRDVAAGDKCPDFADSLETDLETDGAAEAAHRLDRATQTRRPARWLAAAVALIGVGIVIWSAGGADDARRAAVRRGNVRELRPVDVAELATSIEELGAFTLRRLRDAEGGELPAAPEHEVSIGDSLAVTELRIALRGAIAGDDTGRSIWPIELELHLAGERVARLGLAPRGADAVDVGWLSRAGVLNIAPTYERSLRRHVDKLTGTGRRITKAHDAAELHDAIASNVTVLLAADQYRLERPLRIDGIENLWIRPEQPGVLVELTVADRLAPVVVVQGSKAVFLERLSLTHAAGDRSQAPVVRAADCQQLRLARCSLAAGKIGIEADRVARLEAIDSAIRDCSWRISQLDSCPEAVFLHSEFRDSRDGLYFLKCKSPTLHECTVSGLQGAVAIYAQGSDATIVGGRFDTPQRFTGDEVRVLPTARPKQTGKGR